MLHNRVDPQVAKGSDIQKEEAKSRTDLICNNCNVSMFFSEQKSLTLRKHVAELIVTAFERQIGVREKL